MSWLGLAGISIVVAGLVLSSASKEPSEPPPKVRQAAVTGLFYPAQKKNLEETIAHYLEQAKKEPSLGKVKALVCPHAGYRYSGGTAAHGFKQLQGREDIQTAILMGASHYAWFKGASIPDVEAYQTPLGKAKLSPKAKELAQVKPFVSKPFARVERPGWWREAPIDPPPGGDTPHTWEHSLEVEIPFLQTVLPKIEIIPILFGQVEPKEVADSLEKFLDDQTILIVSSDLSHYYPYAKARQLDSGCVEAILNLDTQAMDKKEACGKKPIATLLLLAKKKGWKTKLLDYKNSGDTAGDKRRVVGYAAIAFFEPKKEEAKEKEEPFTEKESSPEEKSADNQTETTSILPAAPEQEPENKKEPAYTQEERAFMLKLARETLENVVRKKNFPKVDQKDLPEKLKETKACFVTLTVGGKKGKEGKLRGCIGHILPKEPLYQSIMDNTRSAALHDMRFPKVKPPELKDIHMEISVLTTPKELEFNSPRELLSKLTPHKDGVILRIGYSQATFLPQVWEHFPRKEKFLNQLAKKAGHHESAWKAEGVRVLTYQVEAFEEPKH